MRKQAGFTLVELLVVISIIGGLAALLLTNFVGIRGRASDATKKSNLTQLKTALRLYYNDYQLYPDGSGGALMGCGSAGTAACSAGGEFSAGADSTLYMKELPLGFAYYSDNADSFVATITLDNASDEEITKSQTKCDPTSKSFFTGTLGSQDFVVCED